MLEVELPPALVSLSDYARSRGISVNALKRAMLEGRVSQAPGGMIDPRVADREWAENTGPKRGHRPPNGALDTPAAGGSGLATLTGIRTQHEQLKLELTRTELEEKKGNLVPKEVMAQALEVEGRRLRDSVFQVPVQVAAALAACQDPQGCKLLVHEALRAALEVLSQPEGET